MVVLGFYWVTVKGRRASAREAPIVTPASHFGFFDPLVFGIRHHSSFVAKAGIRGAPVIGVLARAAQCIFVDRLATSSRHDTVEQIKARAQSKGDWGQLVIWPEGTVTNQRAVITFKSGAFIPGVPVQPVAVRYPFSHFDPTWTEASPPPGRIMLRVLCQVYSCCRVTYLPVHVPTPEECKDPRLFAARVRASIAAELQLPVTAHTYEDVALMIQAKKLSLPSDAAVVEYEALTHVLGSNLDSMRCHLARFAELDSNHDGRLTASEFAAALRIAPCEAVDDIFRCLDLDASGSIDFREFVIGMSLVSRHCTNDDTLALMFRAFDSNGDGTISPDELRAALRVMLPELRPADVDAVFEAADCDRDGRITKDEFASFARGNALYATLFAKHVETRSIGGDVTPMAPELVMSLSDDDQAQAEMGRGRVVAATPTPTSSLRGKRTAKVAPV